MESQSTLSVRAPSGEDHDDDRDDKRSTPLAENESSSNLPVKKALPGGWRFRREGKAVTFKVLEIVGEGTFGKVYKATSLETKEIVAIKRTEIQPNQIYREADIMKLLRHRNICQLKHLFCTKGNDKISALLVMEYVPSSLFDVVKRYRRYSHRMGENYIRSLMFQLLCGLEYMHSKGICHRDLKPANILVNPKANELKICDFGCAKKLVKGEENATYICSRFYRAPEVILESPYTKSIDMWSVGCIFAELYTKEVLFKGASSVEQLIEIIKVIGTPSLNDRQELGRAEVPLSLTKCPPKKWKVVLGSGISEKAIDLISKMLVYSPSKRITAKQALDHTFFDPIRQAESPPPSPSPTSSEKDGDIPQRSD